jgi:exodeoxyribonuclease V alpha subunit
VTPPPPLRELQARGRIRAVDARFGSVVERLAGEHDGRVAVAAALASQAVGDGHSCLDLVQLQIELAGLQLDPDVERWLPDSPACHRPGQAGDAAPLVIDRGRLYLHRYWRLERELARRLRSMAGASAPLPADLDARLRRLIPGSGPGVDGQRLALAVACRRQLAVLSGGPGTGKTSTVAALLQLLDELAGGQAAVALAAPTGKAAARLNESLQRQGVGDRPGIAPACTVHRLLGARGDGRGFRHDRHNPLPCTVLVVDESSMVDLRLMHALFDALAPGARAILLGDPDQLAAVEAGNVFGEINQDWRGYRPEQAALLEDCLGIPVPVDTRAGATADSVAVLRHSFRFAAGGEIGRLAAALRCGDGDRIAAALGGGGAQLEVLPDGAGERCHDYAAEQYAAYLEALDAGAPAAQVMALRQRFQVLAATRSGPRGVSGLNEGIAATLGRRGFLRRRQARHALGEPLLITRNEPGLRLYNGDLGLVVAAADDELRACFPDERGGLRTLPLGRLPEHETAFAMTVHKSQGSEFDRVMLALPAEHRPSLDGLLRRELLYTGVTRARELLCWAGPAPRLPEAWLRPGERQSGLGERVRAPDEREEEGA